MNWIFWAGSVILGGMALFSSPMKLRLPQPEQALPGRETAMPVSDTHFVNGHRLTAPFPAGLEQAVFGMGCFWGAERKFWQAEGVYTTAVGYAGGLTPNPTYREVCSGRTGHAELGRSAEHTPELQSHS